MSAIEIFGFETGNNIKVRIALQYKGLPYDFHTIDPHDRNQVVEISGQLLTPVMRHGQVVLFGSGAIIRYLEANFRETPRLFSGDRKTLVAIEGWETFSRARLAAPLVTVVNHRLQGGDDPAVFEASKAAFQAALAELAPALVGRQWLVGDAMTLADVTSAAIVLRCINFGFCGRADVDPATLAWVDRVVAYDRPPG
jgi:glutathione S-transferase